MSETPRTETQLGIADLTKRFSAAGIAVIAQRINRLPQRSIYFEIGNTERQTDVTLPMNFLDDLPNTKEYQAAVDSYALAVAGRLKCGSPEVFYCRSGVAIRVSIRWPIQAAIYNSVATTFILMDVINQVDGQIAKCSMDLGFLWRHTVFDVVQQTVNNVRTAIDGSLVKFYSPDVPHEVYQRVNPQEQSERPSQFEIEQFLRGKAYILGFIAVDEPSNVWTADPWDAQYLGATKKELSLATRVLQANGVLQATGVSHPFSEYVRPTDKLLAEQSSKKDGEETLSQPPQKVSRLNLPTKDVLLKDMSKILERHPVSALLVIDLDNFKSVNDKLGHSRGDECLDLVVSTIGTVVGRRGGIYRWGSGDEFAICLPDFSTEEAQATAERIRRGIVEAKPGGDIVVTTSIGVCGTDRVESKSANEILDFADKAMYASKQSGRNRVTTWPIGVNLATDATPNPKPAKHAVKGQLTVFLKEGQEIQDRLEFSNIDALRQKQEWEQRVEKYLEKNLDGSYAVRFQNPGHPPTTYPEGINSKMMAPWADTGARMAMLNSFMAELRD
jgi:diguanylate cyclase (GGDEF)-like protein